MMRQTMTKRKTKSKEKATPRTQDAKRVISSLGQETTVIATVSTEERVSKTEQEATDDGAKQSVANRKPFTFLSDITSQATTLLGLGIPFGELSLLDGDPGTNKSSVTLDIAARLSTGTAMPDGSKTSRAGVLLLV